jgi:hypothetical protein
MKKLLQLLLPLLMATPVYGGPRDPDRLFQTRDSLVRQVEQLQSLPPECPASAVTRADIAHFVSSYGFKYDDAFEADVKAAGQEAREVNADVQSTLSEREKAAFAKLRCSWGTLLVSKILEHQNSSK